MIISLKNDIGLSQKNRFMKKYKAIILSVSTLLLVCPSIWSQIPLEVEGELTVNPSNFEIDVHNNAIVNVLDPFFAQDAATKAYVDNLLLSFGVSIGPAGIQGLLDSGFNPATIISNGASLTDFIGLNHAGGIIFYMDPSGNGTGLVSAAMDQSTGAEWGCFGSSITGADGTTIGTGNQNTIDIEAECITSGIAADLCANLSLNGFTDWFLPSRDELNEMWLNLADSDGDGTNAGPSDPNNIGGFADSFYWSSSEFDDIFAWTHGFSDGSQGVDDKENDFQVRAIRAF